MDAKDVQADVEVEQPREDKPGEQLNQEIADRERRLAGTATAAEYPVTDQWNVIVPAHLLKAVPAARTRPDQALLVRNTVDADIEPAPDGRAEHKGEPDPDEEEGFHARRNSVRFERCASEAISEPRWRAGLIGDFVG